MKFIRTVDVGNNKKKKFLYEIPDHIINKRFGNVYIFQNQLINLDDVMEQGVATPVNE
ncbi:MAG: hypothetical protein H8E74_01790 [Gammaproteobacteria bacterium]|nr:hypothetical protein [Gammaproteobacteria bacterium]